MKKWVIQFFAALSFCACSGQTVSKTIPEKLDEYMTALSGAYKFNGVVLVARQGTVLLKKGYGWKNAAAQEASDVNGIFQIGSLTKPFTAEVILKLEEQGKIALDDKLSKYFPDYPKGDRITIENLLTHTSGIPGYDVEESDTIAWTPVTKEQVIGLFRNQPLEFKPGKKYKYSNAGYFLLGMIIEKVTGKSYEASVRELIFQPLQMLNSGFDFIHLEDLRKVTGYAVLNAGEQRPVHLVDSTVSYAAGAMYSDADDLYKWAVSIARQQILSASIWKRAFTPFKSNYGYGWFIDTLSGHDYAGHSGGIMGFTSYLAYFPGEDVTIILLNNFLNEREPLSLPVQDLAAIVFDKPYTIYTEKKKADISLSALDSYTGQYALSPKLKRMMVISKGSDGLQASLNGRVISTLVFQSDTRFQFKNIPNSGGEFIVQDGKVIKMVISQNGVYEWIRIKE